MASGMPPSTQQPCGSVFIRQTEPKEPDIRVVLVGKTGVGKSATGNTILRRKAFESKLSSSSMTFDCQKQTGRFDDKTLAVVDTPGLYDTKRSEEEIVREIGKCISFAAPGPHVFLVVMQPNRFTEEEQKTVKLIQKTFGNDAAQYTIVLYTHGDDVEEDSASIEDIIEGNSDLSDFISQCGGRYHVFNNREKHPSQVKELLKKINTMVEKNKGSYYTNKMFQEAEDAIREETEKLQKENPSMTPEDAREQAEKNNNFIWRFFKAAGIGAGIGATVGVVAGPVGAVIGAGLGSVVGGIVQAVKKDCVIQ